MTSISGDGVCHAATKFMLLYEKGEGDYTKARKALFKDVTIEDIVSEISESKKQKAMILTYLVDRSFIIKYL